MRTASMRGLGGSTPNRPRRLAVLDTAPEFSFGSDDEVLVERIGMGGDLDPFAAAGDHREHRGPRRDHPHVVLQLRHVLLGGRLLREGPGQHELGLEHGAATLDPAIEGGSHPAQTRVANVPLDIGNDLPGIGLVPAPIEVLGGRPRAGR